MHRLWLLLALIAMPVSSRAGMVPDPLHAANAWYSDVLGMPKAWGYSTGSTQVTAAVLDTGVMADTPELANRLLPPQTVPGLPLLDGTSYHHGTWVASVLAMEVGNGRGGAGVGNFTVLPVTVTAASGKNTPEWVAAGIRAAADAGARVINVSHSVTSYSVLDDAAAYARSKGALTFVALGNRPVRLGLTGYDNLIFVSGTNRNDGLWYQEYGVGSTWGPLVDIAAPAERILIADPTLEGGYGLASGTSFAAPLVAGAAALAWSINPDLGVDKVRAMLYGTADDLGAPGWDEVYGYGRLNIGNLAAAAYATVPEPTAGLPLLWLAWMLASRRRGIGSAHG